MIGGKDAGAPQDESARREIGSWNDLAQFVDRYFRVVEVRKARIDHFAEIVRGNVGRHADGNAACAVDKQIGYLRRQHGRLL